MFSHTPVEIPGPKLAKGEVARDPDWSTPTFSPFTPQTFADRLQLPPFVLPWNKIMSASILAEQEDHLLIAIALVAAPALSMSIGSVCVRFGIPSDLVQARFQNVSAGLLIGALLAEIYPMLHQRLFVAGVDRTKVEIWNCTSAFLGFFLALGVMYGLRALEQFHSPNEEVLKEAAKKEIDLEGVRSPASASSPRHVVLQRMATAQLGKLSTGSFTLDVAMNALSKIQKGGDDINVEQLDEQLHFIDFALDSMHRACHGVEILTGVATKDARARLSELLQDVEALQSISPQKVSALDLQIQRTSASLKRLHAQTHPGAFRRWGPRRMTSSSNQTLALDLPDQTGRKSSLPWGLIFAVAIDATVDGMLIGLSTSSSVGAGMLMAIATVIEMGFLGYSFGCTLVSQAQEAKLCRSALVALLALPPLCLASFGALAYVIGEALESCCVFTGLVSFSLVAVLFLVIQELLLEAAEKDEDHNCNVSIFIYFGLFISFALEVVL
ncbi:hypothetical protein AK812_SmicGene41535 [Symbiodinium microadriaticum]|uniref:Uncharacterized protein n=1 Tax=Symbiodinium microadriaticum TaxID=2951 RepID=A0A1Q9C5W1_SYMMI|nr:hypothetical protein AK812_SmicGene41535 [Symbiodinium microadriaticum]CAE7861634.1 unnamed protein product [Symbiodinium microadriaticum]CAE7921294.1 unnamed protein product [Symbiodinium sp. KB8]